MSIHLKKCKVALWFTLRGASCLLFFPVLFSILITLVGEGELVFVLLVHLFVSYAHVNLCPFFSSFWCQGLAATSDCGTLWTFLITFFHCIYIIRSKQFVFQQMICPTNYLSFDKYVIRQILSFLSQIDQFVKGQTGVFRA